MKWLYLVAAALISNAAGAQSYPSKPIRWIVGFPPGGGTDIISRLIAQKMGEAWGQQVLVENRPGATGMIGANAIAKAPPDGYTIGMAHVNSHAIAPNLVEKPLYDPLKDFAPVAYVGYVPNVLVINPAVTPANTIQELVILAKAQPGKLSFASPGVGSTNHLAGEMFKLGAGIDIVHVPYKGSGPAIVDLLGGQITMNFDAMSSIVQHLKQGKMRALAVTTSEPDPQLPGVPTVRQAGFKDFEVTNWYGVVAPAGTSREIVVRLNGEVNRILALPDVVAKLDELGTRRNPMSPDQFGEFARNELEKYRAVAKATGVRME
jgi:tripartite-type tricarboxylate transporter receptor subunit TctC